MMREINFTLPMKYLSIIIVVSEYLLNTGLISTSIYSVLMAISILSFYMLFSKRRGGFSLKEFSILIFSCIFIVLNRDISNFSIGLAWILYFILKKAKINYFEILKTYAVASSICFFITTALFFLTGFNKEANMMMWRNQGFVNRLSLGFVQPNIAMMSFFGMIIALVFLSRGSRRYIILISIATTLVFHFTQSRTSGYLIFLLLLISFCLGKGIFRKANRLEKMIVMVMPLILLALSYLLLKLPVNESLNSILSGRINLYKMIYAEFGIHLIGNSAAKDMMLDTGYLQALIAKGILFSLFLFASLFYIFWDSFKKNSRFDLLVIAMYFLIAFTETSFFRFTILFPVLVVIMMNKQNIYEDESHKG